MEHEELSSIMEHEERSFSNKQRSQNRFSNRRSHRLSPALKLRSKVTNMYQTRDFLQIRSLHDRVDMVVLVATTIQRGMTDEMIEITIGNGIGIRIMYMRGTEIATEIVSEIETMVEIAVAVEVVMTVVGIVKGTAAL